MTAAFEMEDFERVLKVIEDAPRWMQKSLEFQLTRASALASMGEDEEALQILRELERENPRFLAIYVPLAFIYMSRNYRAHTLRAAKRALSDQDLDPENRAILEKEVAETTESLQSIAEGLGLSFETTQRAIMLNEQAEMALINNKFSDVDQFTKEAIKAAPNWNPPYNNRARALYFSGRTAEAVAVIESVLTRDPENTFALESMVMFYIGIDQPEKAQGFVDRLAKRSKKLSVDSDELETAITGLALAENTPALWKIAQRCLEEQSEVMVDRSWFCLTVSAIRSGKWNGPWC